MIVLLVVCSLSAAAQGPTVFAVGLQRPNRVLFTPQGSLLVSEGGTATPNTGRVSILDSGGNRRSLLEGLPSGPAHFTTPFGPTSMALDGSTLYLLLGEGDVMAGTPPSYGINLRGPSSPIFSSVLKVRFSGELEQILAGFRMTLDDHWRLFDGLEVELRNEFGDRANVHLLAAFRPLVRDRAGISRVFVRPSDPYGVVLSPAGKTLYISDASSESVIKVDTETGRSQLVVRFPPLARQTADGPSRVDNVPTGICWHGDQLLVSFLSGAPFPPGGASIRSVNRATGEVATFISGLTAAIDVLCSQTPSGGRFFTLEWTQDFQARVPSGRLRVYDSSGSRTLASQLVLPTGMAQDPVTGDIFVAGYFTGQILRVRLQ